MKLNQGVVPPNNFHYPIDKGVVLRASTYELLVKEIINWKTQNGMPIGDPDKQIDDYVCSKWPSYCNVTNEESKLIQKNSDMLTKVNGWAALTMRDTPAGGYQLVDQSVATNRCKICIDCPFNKAWRSGCGNCMKATDTILIRLRQLRKIMLDESLMGCAINGFDNRTAVHLPLSALKLTEEKLQSIPQNCWIKQSIE